MLNTSSYGVKNLVKNVALFPATTEDTSVSDVFSELIKRATSDSISTTVNRKQDLIDAILTLFSSSSERDIHVNEQDTDSQALLVALRSCKCPDFDLFKVVALEDREGSIPQDHIARLCDVGVVRLLKRCSHCSPDGSSYRALSWCLEYLKILLGSLSKDMQRAGWYGIKIKTKRLPSGVSQDGGSSPSSISRKGAIRSSEGQDLYTVDFHKEMETCTTSEGRISLLAILSALSSIPRNVLDQKLFNEIHPLLMLCLDFGAGYGLDVSVRGIQHRDPQVPVGLHQAGIIYTAEVVSRTLDVCAMLLCSVSCVEEARDGHCGLQFKRFSVDDESRQVRTWQITDYVRKRILTRVFSSYKICYKVWLLEFVSSQPLTKVFHYLHLVLSYCCDKQQEDEDQMLLKGWTTAMAFRSVVDQLVKLDLCDTTIQQSSILKDVVQEACQFVCYAQEDLRSKVKTLPEALVQLQKQVQRVALSVVLTSKTSDRNAAKVNETCDMPSEEVTCSEQTSSEPKLSLASSLKGLTGRQTVPSQTPSFLTSTTVPTATGDLLQLISQEDAQFRLHRLSVLLELAEPGTLPQPDLLASLLDFAGKAPVVLRAAVFVECAHFVHQLRHSHKTAWLLANYKKSRNVLHNIRRWGEVLGLKLKKILDREKQFSFVNSKRKLDILTENFVPTLTLHDQEEKVSLEETTFSKSTGDPRHVGVAYSLKVAACQLLYEITAMLVDPPSFYKIHASQYVATETSASDVEKEGGSLNVPQLRGVAIRKKKNTTNSTPQMFRRSYRGTFRQTRKTAQPTEEDLPTAIPPSDSQTPSLSTSVQPPVKQHPRAPVRKSIHSMLTADNPQVSHLGSRFTNIWNKFTGTSGEAVRKKSTHLQPTPPMRRPTIGRHKSFLGREGSPHQEVDYVHLPWSETVAELLLPSCLRISEYEADPDRCLQKRKHQCLELFTALLKVYSYDSSGDTEKQGSPALVTSPNSRSFKEFHATWRSKHGGSLSNGSSRLMSPASEASHPRTASLSQSVEDLVNRQLMTYSPCKGCHILPIALELDALQASLEQETTGALQDRLRDFKRKRQKYMKENISTLLSSIFHTILSVTDDLSKYTISHLRDISWSLLLDTDTDLSSLAGTFLLVIADGFSRDELCDYFQSKCNNARSTDTVLTVARFAALWNLRNQVMPRIPRASQLKFYARASDVSLGIALPTPKLGSELGNVPAAPWQPLSLCIGQRCQEDPEKCSHSTRFAPQLFHTSDILSDTAPFNVTGVSVSQKAYLDSQDLLSEEDAQRDDVGHVFPDSLLPLILQVVAFINISTREDALPQHHRQTAAVKQAQTKALRSGYLQQRRRVLLKRFISTDENCPLDASAAAREVVYQCMVEDYQVFFQPVLHFISQAFQEATKNTRRTPVKRFTHSTEEDINAVLQSLRTILLTYPRIPAEAAHYLYNHLIGLAMQNTGHGYVESPDLVKELLDLAQLLSPSVKGLSGKLLKNSLKKEPCYSVVMETAKVFGAKQVTVFFKKSEKQQLSHVISVTDSTTVENLLIDALNKHSKHLGMDLGSPSNYALHLVPGEFEKRGFVPTDSTKLLKSVVLHDHFSSSSRTQSLHFTIEEESPDIQVVFEKEHAFLQKMTNIGRVLLANRLSNPLDAKWRPDLREDSFRFLYNELKDLPSFPRKALNSITSLSGLLESRHLYTSDVMLKGVWLEFLLNLFQSMPTTFKWSSEMVLFLSVVTGSMMLHAEDVNILRLSVAVLLKLLYHRGHQHQVTKVSLEARQAVIFSIIKVYAVHCDNQLVKGTLELLWSHLYKSGDQRFLLDVASACKPITGKEPLQQSQLVQFLSFSMPTQSSAHMDTTKEKLMRAVFHLLKTLSLKTPPVDSIGAESLAGVRPITESNDLDLTAIFNLYVTIVCAGPDKEKAQHVVIFLSHLAPFLVQDLSSQDNQLNNLNCGIRNLSKVFESYGNVQLTLLQKTEKLGGIGDNGRGNQKRDQHRDVPDERSTNEIPLNISTRPELSQRTSTLDSLLFLVAQVSAAAHAVHGKDSTRQAGSLRRDSQYIHTTVHSLHHKTITINCNIAIQLLKSLVYGDLESEVFLKGFKQFCELFLTSIPWDEGSNHAIFGNFISQVTRIVKKIEPSRTANIWPQLASLIKGISQCVSTSHLATTEFHNIVDLIDSFTGEGRLVHTTSLQSNEDNSTKAENTLAFLKQYTVEFSQAFAKLLTALILKPVTDERRQVYSLKNILKERLQFTSEIAKALLVRRIMLPTLLALGSHHDLDLPQEDLNYLIQVCRKHSDDMSTRMSCGQSYPVQGMFKSYFFILKVIILVFSKNMTALHWQMLVESINLLSIRDKAFSIKKTKRSTQDVYSLENSDQLQYYQEFLTFVEEFVMVYPTPVCLYLWSSLRIVEKGLHEIKVDLESRLSTAQSQTGREELLSSQYQDYSEELQEQYHTVAHCIEQCEGIIDAFFEDKDQLSVVELLEGLETDLYNNIYFFDDILPSNKGEAEIGIKQRSPSISDYLVRKKREIFATLGTSLSRATGEESDSLEGRSVSVASGRIRKRSQANQRAIPKIDSDTGSHVEGRSVSVASGRIRKRSQANQRAIPKIDSDTGSHVSEQSHTSVGSKQRVRSPKRALGKPLLDYKAASSESEDEFKLDKKLRTKKTNKGRRPGLPPKGTCYEADTEGVSHAFHVQVEIHDSNSLSHQKGSGKPRSLSSVEPPMERLDIDTVSRKLSDTSNQPQNVSLLHVQSASDHDIGSATSVNSKPRSPSPMLISHKARNPKRMDSDSSTMTYGESIDKEDLEKSEMAKKHILQKSMAIQEDQSISSPAERDSEVEMVESPTSGQRHPLLPGDHFPGPGAVIQSNPEIEDT